MDYGTEVIWCPTPPNHTGQPSDRCGGTFKRWITLETNAGNLRGVTTAGQLVEFCESQPMFRQTSHQKYKNATTTRCTFTHMTKQAVEITIPKQLAASRSVQTLVGVSKLKQAFSLQEGFTLLARERGCCCRYCIQRNFADCELKEYVDKPKFIQLIPENRHRPVTRSQPLEENNVHTIKVIPGYFYALEDSKELKIVKCISVENEDSFTGILMLPCRDTDTVYRESELLVCLSSLVHAEILSVEKLNSGNISINMIEVEELLFSINM